MRIAIVALLAMGIGVPTARAENCVDKEVARTSGGRPCMDVSASMGRFELWRGPGLIDLRVGVMRMMLYGDGRATGFELGTWETVGKDGDLEGPRDLGPRSALHVLALRRQHDHHDWGVYLAADLLTHWYGALRGVTPRVGLRLGHVDDAALIVEGRLAGAFLFGDYDAWSPLRDFDVSARASSSLSRRWRVEARGRYRDLTATDGYHLRDVTAAVGVNLELGPRSSHHGPTEDRFRAVTLFAGVAVRQALVDDADDEGAVPTARAVPVQPRAPWQVLAWLDLDFTIDSDRNLW